MAGPAVDPRAIDTGDHGTFRSLRSRNFRLLVAGQAISQSGSSLQLVALAWVALGLTANGTALGWVMTAAFGPMLLLAPWVGSLADRHDKHALLIAAQVAAAVQAAVLATLVFTGELTGLLLFALALAHGIVQAFEVPLRRAFVAETVRIADSVSAASLSGTVSAVCRVSGPVLAGLILIGPGAGWCFVANTVAYLIAMLTLALVHRAELEPVAPATGRAGAVRAGLRYAWAVPELRVTLLLTAVLCTLGFNHQVVIPLLAERALGGGAGTYTLLYTAMTVGSVLGGLLAARRASVDTRFLGRAAIAFGAATALLAAAPTAPWAVLAAAAAGTTGLLFVCASTGLLQLRCAPEMRGRILALSAVVVFGGIALGSPLLGWLCETLGPRWGLYIAAITVAATGAAVLASRAGPRS